MKKNKNSFMFLALSASLFVCSMSNKAYAEEYCTIAQSSFEESGAVLDINTIRPIQIIEGQSTSGNLTIKLDKRVDMVSDSSPVLKKRTEGGMVAFVGSDEKTRYLWLYAPEQEKRIMIINVMHPNTGYVVVCN